MPLEHYPVILLKIKGFGAFGRFPEASMHVDLAKSDTVSNADNYNDTASFSAVLSLMYYGTTALQMYLTR